MRLFSGRPEGSRERLFEQPGQRLAAITLPLVMRAEIDAVQMAAAGRQTFPQLGCIRARSSCEYRPSAMPAD